MPYVNRLSQGGYQPRGDRWDICYRGSATLEEARVFTRRSFAIASLEANKLSGTPVRVELREVEEDAGSE